MNNAAVDYGGGLGGDVFFGAGTGFMSEKEPGALAFAFGAYLLHDFAHARCGFGCADEVSPFEGRIE